MTISIPHLDVGSGRHAGALSVFPVWTDAPHLRGIVWSTDVLEASELDDGAEVERLQVTNRSPRMTALIEGDLLVGGRQHRMAARSRLLGAGTREEVDVLCVEQGRWSGSGGHSASGLRAAPSVRFGNADPRGLDAQGEVWRRISRYDRELGRSRTSSMLDHLGTDPERHIGRMPGQRGVIIGIGGRVVGAEIFGSARALAARWDGLLRAARLDARLAAPLPTSSSQARRFARTLGAARLEVADESPLTRSVDARTDALRVSGLVRTGSGHDAPIHLMAFDPAHPLLECV